MTVLQQIATRPGKHPFPDCDRQPKAYIASMGRIIAQVILTNAMDPQKEMRFSALVDTGAAYLSLPAAWKDRMGSFPSVMPVQIETATQDSHPAEIAGPVRIEIEGFRPIHSEVLFVEMTPEAGEDYEPLLGYIPLEQAQIAVDMLGHRLVAAKRIDLK